MSLDFELHWGVRDEQTLRAYGPRLLGARTAVLRLLDLFAEHGVHATWATVGFLFFDGRDELLAALPSRRPDYVRRELSPYASLRGLGRSEAADPLHFAPSLIARIHETPCQEIGTHTFSHYYCLERGQDLHSFRADLRAAIAVARNKFGVEIESLVFPRNQYAPEHLLVLRELGIRAFRGNLPAWMFAERSGEDESLLRRGARLADAYLPLSGSNAYKAEPGEPCNFPASRFLRPWSRRLARFDERRLERILADLDRAAREKLVYHLWWHPHNFGGELDRNLAFLRRILGRYVEHRSESDFASLSMGEAAACLSEQVP